MTNEWVWVKKKLPEDGERVVAYCGWNGDTYIAVRRNNKWYLTWDNKTELIKISHWMSLPDENPKNGECW